MIPVSDGWRTAHRQLLVPEAFVEIRYLATDPDVQDTLTSSSEDDMFYSDTGSLVNELDKNVAFYSTLEDGLCLLDGNEKYLPESDYGKTGYVSESWCNDECIFEKTPLISISSTQIHENVVLGITLTWSSAYNEFPVRYEVKVWKDNQVVSSYMVENNNSIFNVLEFDYDNYNRITIEIFEWCLPNKRARMEEVLIGVEKIYTKKDLMGFEHIQECDILSGSLPKNEVIFKLDNSDNLWNPTNASGVEKYLLERQEIRVRYGYEINDSIEWIDATRVYISEWNVPSNGLEATFTCKSLLDFMNSIYTGKRSGTLYEICETALLQANLPLNRNGSYKWHIDEKLKKFATNFEPEDGDEPEEYKISEVVQLCANAGGCIMYQDHLGQIRIEPQFLVLDDYRIDALVSYSYPELKTSKELKSVNVNDGLAAYSVSPKGEIQTVDNEFIISKENAEEVAEWIGDTLKFRTTISGDFRIDPRVEVTDLIAVEGKFGISYAVGLTKVALTYNGAFRGTYEGRVFEFKPVEASYVGLPFSGEV